MMIIGEGMCYSERCELCETEESQTCTLKLLIFKKLF